MFTSRTVYTKHGFYQEWLVRNKNGLHQERLISWTAYTKNGLYQELFVPRGVYIKKGYVKNDLRQEQFIPKMV